MSPSDFSKSQIALACWRAAKSDLHPVMLSVCMVFRNRAAAGYYNGDLYSNAVQWLVDNPGEFPDVRDPQFCQMLSKLDSVTSGMVQDKTDGALWFFPKDSIGANQFAEGFRITTSIGNLVFLR